MLISSSTKWPPFHRQRFQMYFMNEKFCILNRLSLKWNLCNTRACETFCRTGDKKLTYTLKMKKKSVIGHENMHRLCTGRLYHFTLDFQGYFSGTGTAMRLVLWKLRNFRHAKRNKKNVHRLWDIMHIQWSMHIHTHTTLFRIELVTFAVLRIPIKYLFSYTIDRQ